jgi:transglutaminase-like putative cysteine protease
VIRLNTLLYANTVACVLVALASCAGAVAPSHVTLFLALSLIAFAIDALGLRRPPRLVINAVSVCALLWIVRALRYSNVIETFTGAVLLLISVKMLEEKRWRDYLQILGLAVLAVLSAAIVSYVESVVYYSLLISALAGAELVLMSWHDKQPGARLTVRQALRTLGCAALIWASMLPICFALFFAAPRTRAVMAQFQRPGGSGSTFSGFSDHVTLGSVKEIQLSDETAFRAETPPLPPNALYWRGMTLEAFNGSAWFPMRRSFRNGPFAAEGTTVVQKILMEPGYHRVFFALDKPMHVDNRNAVDMGDGNFTNTDYRASGRLEYTAISSVSPFMKPLDPDRDKRIYLALPEGFMPELREITAGMTYGKSDREKAEAIMAYLGPPNFEYSLSDLPTSDSPLSEFIFSSRMGNCEYFATAMAVMLRQAGVPSRLVAGYQGGEYNRGSGYYIVSQADAHVWVEAWNRDAGSWVRYDPTPSSLASGGAQAEAKYNFLSFYIDALNYRVSKIFLEYDSESQWEILGSFRRAIENSRNLVLEGKGEFFRSLWKLAALAAAAGTVFLAAVAARSAIRRRRDRESALLRDFLRVMKRKGYEKNPCDGLEEFVSSIGGEPSVAPRLGELPVFELARSFVLRFEEFYFRDLPIDTDTETELRSILKKIRSA